MERTNGMSSTFRVRQCGGHVVFACACFSYCWCCIILSWVFPVVTEVVASLEATDEFLKNRVMNLPESVVAGTHNTEEGRTCHVKALPAFKLFFFPPGWGSALKLSFLSNPCHVILQTSAGLMRRLAEFRAINTEDETVLNYFDELEIHPDHIGE